MLSFSLKKFFYLSSAKNFNQKGALIPLPSALLSTFPSTPIVLQECFLSDIKKLLS